MPCCDNHDRLDKVLHAEEYTGNICGTNKNVTVQIQGANGGVTHNPHPERLTKPHYCCSECPTLVAKHKAA